MRDDFGFEVRRQVVHALTGVVLAYILLSIGKTNFLYFALAMMLVIGLAIFYIQGHIHSKLADIIGIFERQGSQVFSGAFLFMVGALIAALLFPEAIAAYAILVLGIADAVSTAVGVAIGRHKLKWNSEKSYEGSLAFLVAAVAVLLLAEAPLAAFVIAVIVTAVESLPRINDNITIPIAAGALMLII